MLMIFRLDEYVLAEIKQEKLPKMSKFGPKILLAVCIGILDDIYKRVAAWLNEMGEWWWLCGNTAMNRINVYSRKSKHKTK